MKVPKELSVFIEVVATTGKSIIKLCDIIYIEEIQGSSDEAYAALHYIAPGASKKLMVDKKTYKKLVEELTPRRNKAS